MPLTNSQYGQLMHAYEQRQLDNEQKLRDRRGEIYTAIPEMRQLDDAISELSVSSGKRFLQGDGNAISSLGEEIARLSAKKRCLLSAHGYSEDYLELHYTCPDCKDTGYIGAGKCHCFKKAIVDMLYAQSNLKEILAKENFSTCRLDYYSTNHIDPLTGRSSREAFTTALHVCHEFVDTFFKDFRNILLYGDTGVGKTFLSHCIARELIESSCFVIYFTAARLFDIFARNTFGKHGESDTDDYEHIYNCDLLIIDDLGTELPNSFTISQLFVCLNERILRRKSTIISTNLSLEDVKSIYSERIFSRLSSHYSMLRLTGDDIRIQKKLLTLGGTKDATS